MNPEQINFLELSEQSYLSKSEQTPPQSTDPNSCGEVKKEGK